MIRGITMKRIFSIILCSFVTLFSVQVNAYESLADNQSHIDEYTWIGSDANQKKIASGMVTFGILFAVGAIVLSGFIPNSTARTANTSKNAPSSGSLF